MYNSKTIITISFIFIATMALAQHQHGKGMMYHMYDPSSEVTVSGTVEDTVTEVHPCCGSTMNHYYIKVKTNNETVIITKTVKTKDKEVTFRNDDGTPKWAGQMKYKKYKMNQ